MFPRSFKTNPNGHGLKIGEVSHHLPRSRHIGIAMMEQRRPGFLQLLNLIIWWDYNSYLSINLSVCLSIYLCYLSMLSIYVIYLCYLSMLSIYVIYLCYLSINLSVCLSIYVIYLCYLSMLSIYVIYLCYLSMLYIYVIYLCYLSMLSIYVIYLSIYLSVCLSIYVIYLCYLSMLSIYVI